jgi:PAS domain S-box-containing protein
MFENINLDKNIVMIDQRLKQILRETSTDVILESISDGVFTVDYETWRITSFNRAAEEITDINKGDALGKPCSEVFRSSMCGENCPLRTTLKTRQPIINASCYIINGKGKRVPISISTAILCSENGEVLGGVETFRDLTEVVALRKELKERFSVGSLVSHSPSMRKVFDLVSAVSSSSSTILIQGETGTGKELLAKTVHSLGDRSAKPFIAVNCGALPDTLLESELFGYKKGAFTGAVQDKKGRFALAENGTLFLDEIGEITPALQVRLLRVLQERSYEPLGSTKSEHSEARIIAATNQNLFELVKQGKFREDLFYRINVIRIDLPPLRQRKEDIPLLINHFIGYFNQLQMKDIEGVSTEAFSILMAYDWPGNIRELENVIERAFVLCSGRLINADNLPEDINGCCGIINKSTDMLTVKRVSEKQAILNALKNNRFNRTAAAKELNIHKTTLYRKIKQLKIDLPDKDGRFT